MRPGLHFNEDIELKSTAGIKATHIQTGNVLHIQYKVKIVQKVYESSKERFSGIIFVKKNKKKNSKCLEIQILSGPLSLVIILYVEGKGMHWMDTCYVSSKILYSVPSSWVSCYYS